MRPKLEILILTLPQRKCFLEQVLRIFDHQCGPGKGASYRVMMHDPDRMAVGDAKQQLKEASTGEYICFFDDDDLPAPDYVDRIVELLDRDYVGFQVQCYDNFERRKPTFHSIRYDGWSEDDDGYYRGISHINPMRRELSLAVRIEGALTDKSGEDYRWAMEMSRQGIVKTEQYIPAVMYHYYPRIQPLNEDGDPFDNRRLGEMAKLYAGMPDLLAKIGAQTIVPPDRPAIFAPAVPPIPKPKPPPPVSRQQPQEPIIVMYSAFCPKCKSTAVGMAGGMRRCNQCGHGFV